MATRLISIAPVHLSSQLHQSWLSLSPGSSKIIVLRPLRLYTINPVRPFLLTNRAHVLFTVPDESSGMVTSRSPESSNPDAMPGLSGTL
ncbi:MAG: hypothetical protein ACRCUE_01180 [Bosea sp. (in: a-proteobacteria)]